MAFPSTPVKGDTHTEYGSTFFFNGVTWVSSWGVVDTFSQDIVTAASAPSGAPVGMRWLESSTFDLKEYDGSVWNTISTVTY